MPEFHFRMAQPDGTVRSGVMTAPDEPGLAAAIRSGGGVLLSARRARPRKAPNVRVSRSERIAFTHNMQAALAAGVPPTEALRGFAAHVPNKAFARMLTEAAQAVEGGQTVAGALGRFPAAFSPLYVSMVATGEESGRLDDVLGRLADYLEWQDGLVHDLKQATVYPAVVIALVIALTVFLLAFVLPRFVAIFGSGNPEALPVAALWLMAVGRLFSRGWPYLVGGAAGAAAGFAVLKRRPAVALWLDRAALRVPLFGPAVRLIRLSQLTYCLGLLLDAGVDVSRALTLCREVVENRYLAQRMVEVHDRVIAGSTITEALATVGMMPPLTLQMVAVGEQAGGLPGALARATDFLRREVHNALRMALAILEPSIIVFLGGVVGGIALTIFYTLYRMIMAIGGAH